MSRKSLLITAALLIILGGMLFTLALACNGFDIVGLISEEKEMKNYEINDSFSKININAKTADISFAAHPENRVEVECTESKSIVYDVWVENDSLNIRVNDNRKWYEHIGLTFGYKIVVYLPEGKELGGVDIKTDTGNIECGINVTDSVKLKTVTGKIELKNINCRYDVEVKANTGSVTLTDINCRNLISDTNTGGVTLKNVIASEGIKVECNTGSISLDDCDAQELKLTASTGSVKGNLLSDKVFNAESSTGKIDVPSTAKGGKCEVKTSTGNIKLQVK